MKTHLRLAWCPLLAVLGMASTCGALDLGELASYRIVLPADAAPAVSYAADELRALVAKATGQQLTITTEPERSQRCLFVGAGSAMRASPVRFETGDLGEEDVRIVVRGDCAAMAGGSPRGTLYAAYSFAEDLLGVRFLTPDHTHVPRIAESHVVPDQDLTVRPVFRWRYAYYGANHEHPEFAARLRNNAVTRDPQLGGRTDWQLINHSFSHFLPVHQYGQEHPEYFSLVDGRRRGFVSEDHFGDGGTQLCLTNPQVRQLATEFARRYLREHPEHGNVSISQNDNQMYCRCPDCRAIDEREGTPMGSLLSLVNEVAGAVARHHPGKFVGTLAYQYSRRPPAGLRPADNVAVQLCSIEACLIHPIDDPDCPRNRAFCRDLADWGRICQQMYIWNYNVNFHNYLAPCPNLRVIGPNLRYFAANNCRGVFMQAAGNAQATELCDLRNYLISRLLWDPDQDEQVLVDEFLELHYGRAAEPIRRYIQLIHDNARQREIHHHCFGTAADYGVDEQLADQAVRLFEEGLELAESDVIRDRVEKASITAYAARIDPVARWIREHYRQVRAGEAPQPPADLVQRHRDDLERLFALGDKYGVDRYSEWLPTETVRKMFP
jgi:hypothetical protein